MLNFHRFCDRFLKNKCREMEVAAGVFTLPKTFKNVFEKIMKKKSCETSGKNGPGGGGVPLNTLREGLREGPKTPWTLHKCQGHGGG